MKRINIIFLKFLKCKNDVKLEAMLNREMIKRYNLISKLENEVILIEKLLMKTVNFSDDKIKESFEKLKKQLKLLEEK